MRISPWWLLAAAIATGAALTGIADLASGTSLSAIEWLGTTVGVAALVIAVGIYRLQERSGTEAHAELMDQLEAQNEILGDFAKRAAEQDEAKVEPTALSSDQRAEIESRFGKDSIAAAIDPGARGRGRGARGPGARLVRLNDGRLVSVYERRGQTYVREIPAGRRR